MAASSNDGIALTLHQWAVEANNPMVAAVIKALYFTGNVIQDIGFVNDETMYADIVRYVGNLPVPTSARVGDPPVSVNAFPERYREQAYMVRNNIDTDYVLTRDKNVIGGPGKLRASKVEAYLEGFKYWFNNLYFNNNHAGLIGASGGYTADPLAGVGLRYRLDNPAAFKLNTEMKFSASVGTTCDLSPTGMTVATANRYIELLDQLLFYTGAQNGDGCVLYMPDLLIRRTATALRLLGVGGWGFVKDPYDRQFDSYKNAKIVDVGRTAPLQDGTQTNRVITLNEQISGVDGVAGTDVYTSVYVARYGDNQMKGWQFETLRAEDLGRMNDGVTFRTFFQFIYGFITESPRCIGRMYGIKMA